MRRRFFVPQFEGDSAELHGAAAEHLARVLRAEAGQIYELSDGRQVRVGADRARRAGITSNSRSMEQIPGEERHRHADLSAAGHRKIRSLRMGN